MRRRLGRLAGGIIRSLRRRYPALLAPRLRRLIPRLHSLLLYGCGGRRAEAVGQRRGSFGEGSGCAAPRGRDGGCRGRGDGTAAVSSKACRQGCAWWHAGM